MLARTFLSVYNAGYSNGGVQRFFRVEYAV